jgi:quercetin dioxygenase-like cupin family protein
VFTVSVGNLPGRTRCVVEITFPPAFKGRAHPAPVNEMAYVLEGEFTVISIPEGKRVLKAGAVDWTTKGAIHSSRNDSTKPTRVLVILLKER